MLKFIAFYSLLTQCVAQISNGNSTNDRGFLSPGPGTLFNNEVLMEYANTFASTRCLYNIDQLNNLTFNTPCACSENETYPNQFGDTINVRCLPTQAGTVNLTYFRSLPAGSSMYSVSCTSDQPICVGFKDGISPSERQFGVCMPQEKKTGDINLYAFPQESQFTGDVTIDQASIHEARFVPVRTGNVDFRGILESDPSDFTKYERDMLEFIKSGMRHLNLTDNSMLQGVVQGTHLNTSEIFNQLTATIPGGGNSPNVTVVLTDGCKTFNNHPSNSIPIKTLCRAKWAGGIDLDDHDWNKQKEIAELFSVAANLFGKHNNNTTFLGRTLGPQLWQELYDPASLKTSSNYDTLVKLFVFGLAQMYSPLPTSYEYGNSEPLPRDEINDKIICSESFPTVPAKVTALNTSFVKICIRDNILMLNQTVSVFATNMEIYSAQAKDFESQCTIAKLNVSQDLAFKDVISSVYEAPGAWGFAKCSDMIFTKDNENSYYVYSPFGICLANGMYSYSVLYFGPRLVQDIYTLEFRYISGYTKSKCTPGLTEIFNYKMSNVSPSGSGNTTGTEAYLRVQIPDLGYTVALRDDSVNVAVQPTVKKTTDSYIHLHNTELQSMLNVGVNVIIYNKKIHTEGIITQVINSSMIPDGFLVDEQAHIHMIVYTKWVKVHRISDTGLYFNGSITFHAKCGIKWLHDPLRNVNNITHVLNNMFTTNIPSVPFPAYVAFTRFDTLYVDKIPKRVAMANVAEQWMPRQVKHFPLIYHEGISNDICRNVYKYDTSTNNMPTNPNFKKVEVACNLSLAYYSFEKKSFKNLSKQTNVRMIDKSFLSMQIMETAFLQGDYGKNQFFSHGYSGTQRPFTGPCYFPDDAITVNSRPEGGKLWGSTWDVRRQKVSPIQFENCPSCLGTNGVYIGRIQSGFEGAEQAYFSQSNSLADIKCNANYTWALQEDYTKDTCYVKDIIHDYESLSDSLGGFWERMRAHANFTTQTVFQYTRDGKLVETYNETTNGHYNPLDFCSLPVFETINKLNVSGKSGVMFENNLKVIYQKLVPEKCVPWDMYMGGSKRIHITEFVAITKIVETKVLDLNAGMGGNMFGRNFFVIFDFNRNNPPNVSVTQITHKACSNNYTQPGTFNDFAYPWFQEVRPKNKELISLQKYMFYPVDMNVSSEIHQVYICSGNFPGSWDGDYVINNCINDFGTVYPSQTNDYRVCTNDKMNSNVEQSPSGRMPFACSNSLVETRHFPGQINDVASPYKCEIKPQTVTIYDGENIGRINVDQVSYGHPGDAKGEKLRFDYIKDVKILQRILKYSQLVDGALNYLRHSDQTLFNALNTHITEKDVWQHHFNMSVLQNAWHDSEQYDIHDFLLSNSSFYNLYAQSTYPASNEQTEIVRMVNKSRFDYFCSKLTLPGIGIFIDKTDPTFTSLNHTFSNSEIKSLKWGIVGSDVVCGQYHNTGSECNNFNLTEAIQLDQPNCSCYYSAYTITDPACNLTETCNYIFYPKFQQSDILHETSAQQEQFVQFSNKGLFSMGHNRDGLNIQTVFTGTVPTQIVYTEHPKFSNPGRSVIENEPAGITDEQLADFCRFVANGRFTTQPECESMPRKQGCVWDGYECGLAETTSCSSVQNMSDCEPETGFGFCIVVETAILDGKLTIQTPKSSHLPSLIFGPSGGNSTTLQCVPFTVKVILNSQTVQSLYKQGVVHDKYGQDKGNITMQNLLNGNLRYDNYLFRKLSGFSFYNTSSSTNSTELCYSTPYQQYYNNSIFGLDHMPHNLWTLLRRVNRSMADTCLTYEHASSLPNTNSILGSLAVDNRQIGVCRTQTVQGWPATYTSPVTQIMTYDDFQKLPDFTPWPGNFLSIGQSFTKESCPYCSDFVNNTCLIGARNVYKLDQSALYNEHGHTPMYNKTSGLYRLHACAEPLIDYQDFESPIVLKEQCKAFASHVVMATHIGVVNIDNLCEEGICVYFPGMKEYPTLGSFLDAIGDYSFHTIYVSPYTFEYITYIPFQAIFSDVTVTNGPNQNWEKNISDHGLNDIYTVSEQILLSINGSKIQPSTLELYIHYIENRQIDNGYKILGSNGIYSIVPHYMLRANITDLDLEITYPGLTLTSITDSFFYFADSQSSDNTGTRLKIRANDVTISRFSVSLTDLTLSTSDANNVLRTSPFLIDETALRLRLSDGYLYGTNTIAQFANLDMLVETEQRPSFSIDGCVVSNIIYDSMAYSSPVVGGAFVEGNMYVSFPDQPLLKQNPTTECNIYYDMYRTYFNLTNYEQSCLSLSGLFSLGYNISVDGYITAHYNATHVTCFYLNGISVLNNTVAFRQVSEKCTMFQVDSTTRIYQRNNPYFCIISSVEALLVYFEMTNASLELIAYMEPAKPCHIGLFEYNGAFNYTSKANKYATMSQEQVFPDPDRGYAYQCKWPNNTIVYCEFEHMFGMNYEQLPWTYSYDITGSLHTCSCLNNESETENITGANGGYAICNCQENKAAYPGYGMGKLAPHLNFMNSSELNVFAPGYIVNQRITHNNNIPLSSNNSKTIVSIILTVLSFVLISMGVYISRRSNGQYKEKFD